MIQFEQKDSGGCPGKSYPKTERKGPLQSSLHFLVLLPCLNWYQGSQVGPGWRAGYVVCHKLCSDWSLMWMAPEGSTGKLCK